MSDEHLAYVRPTTVDVGWDAARFCFYVYVRGTGPDGREHVALPVELRWKEISRGGMAVEPTLTLDSVEPWLAGFQKLFPAAADVARLNGRIEAMERHLTDLRALVFRERGVEGRIEIPAEDKWPRR